MTGPPDPVEALRRARLRTSDADREHVIETLKGAFVQGRLTKDELDLRVGQTFLSRTYAELATLTADIPAGSADAPRRPKPAPAQPPASQASKANKKATICALVTCAHIPVAMIVVAVIIGSDSLARAAAPMVFAYFMFVAMAAAHLIDSRLKRRARRPGPGAVTAHRAS